MADSSPKPRRPSRPIAVFHARITLHNGDQISAPTIRDVEACLKAAVEKRWPQYEAHVDATRTDI